MQRPSGGRNLAYSGTDRGQCGGQQQQQECWLPSHTSINKPFISRELTIPLIMSNTNDATLFTMAGADVCIRQALKALLSWVPGAPSG